MAKNEAGRYPNAKELKGLSTTDKKQKIYLGDYLYIAPLKKGKQGKAVQGRKAFYFRGYRFNGRQITDFSIGAFKYSKNDRNGDLTLSEARDKVSDIIRVYRDGIDYRESQRKRNAVPSCYKPAHSIIGLFVT